MNGKIRRTKMANKNNPFSSYYNYPKAWGEAPAEERWHSDPSEQGITPPWIKDAFGFGTEKPAPKLDEADWIPFKYKDKKYEFINIPEVHKIMQSGKVPDIFDNLLNEGLIRNVKE
jgi:hypothetical protein